MGVYKRFVQAGRGVVLRLGPDAGKAAVIVEIVDLKRVIIDGPTSGVPRQMITLNRLQLTDLVLEECKRGCSSEKLVELLKENDIIAAYKQSSAAKSRAVRINLRRMNDFERFKVQRAQRHISRALKAM
eukprot:Blabericola_migrator_1__1608@NODE_1428_length_4562_cov_231_103003_g949_i0_p4_GENE_NODE_1428_length_4562_cov_231_103003_g949_i0NODE_1428_length_4562_cov_231_103003_g949_i0_p4_ORF_typecomplete_len129_score28_67Ribosomal_L14e/PF01929_17/5_2e16KOW/PF00467_29/0_038_NODE_1428_length_4562_cov_231_103003_g949_i029415